MRVIGTAGHVDHGKSTLVYALTGTHPDRLKEEREREMTIDLGFAWMTLPNGEQVGIVDVPGHRDFIENMLAGVGGIDAALFVVAADEGVMPQTREHLAILDLLQIPGGVIALTKIDMVDDPLWLELVEDDVRKAVRGSVLQDAPIVRVSARSGAGLPELQQSLAACLADRPPRLDLGRPRLSIDRVFTMPGFGTIVTGTLTDGSLQIGDELEVLPAGLRGRVRGLQSHKHKTERAAPGSRTAVNLGGIDLDQVRRGDLIAHPGDYHPTRRLDARLRLLPDVSQPLLHNTEVKFFLAASESIARLRLLGTEQLLPGETGWIQLELREPVVAVRGDRYILRRPSPGETLGGGIVVDPFPKKRHKRFDSAALAGLETLSAGSPQEVVLQALQTLGAAQVKAVTARSMLDPETSSQAMQTLFEQGLVVVLDPVSEARLIPDALVTSRAVLERFCQLAISTLQAFHASRPLRLGMPREELKSRLKLDQRMFNTVLRELSTKAQIVEEGGVLRLAVHSIRLNPRQQQIMDELLSRFRQAKNSPPSVKESLAQVGDELYQAALDLDLLVQVSLEVVFTRTAYDSMRSRILQALEQQGEITVAQVRDMLDTSRKYVLALMEHFDTIGLTVRDGDVRRLRSRSG